MVRRRAAERHLRAGGRLAGAGAKVWAQAQELVPPPICRYVVGAPAKAWAWGRKLAHRARCVWISQKPRNIRKVYSIWICQNVPEDRQHSIVQYDISERVISSLHPVKPEEKRNYDLMTVMMLGLGDPSVREADDVLRMLSTALSPEIDAEQKKRVMSEEFGICMTEAMERSVSNMCNLSYNITEEAEARGEARGRALGEAMGETRGKLIQLYELVHEGLLSLSLGADKANQTVAEFQAGMDAYYVNAG